MRVAVRSTFAASRKVFNRVHQAFLDAGLGEPAIRFTFGDAPAFGEQTLGAASIGNSIAGIMLVDSWWVNGRQRGARELLEAR
jgi:hypothetical protein